MSLLTSMLTGTISAFAYLVHGVQGKAIKDAATVVASLATTVYVISKIDQ